MPDAVKLSKLTDALDPLLHWYQENKRDLPWRRPPLDPYRTWVSEVMLQQTGVSTVIPYFERWMARFPTAESLAQAEENEVLALWQGLGYYKRARNLLEGAKLLQARVPITELPGVGRYTAAAIASIALNQPEPLVDGNVERVYARLTADPTPKPTRQAWLWAANELRKQNPGDWNQALMELGATICTPRKPNCPACPIHSACQAYTQGLQETLPTPAPKPETVVLKFDVWLLEHQGRIGLVQQPQGAWWHGLWTSPFNPKANDTAPPYGAQAPVPLKPLRHTVTKHRITFFPFHAQLPRPDPTLRWAEPDELAGLPKPSWQNKLIRLLGH
jgi:A/G-specific adenine glycosylase